MDSHMLILLKWNNGSRSQAWEGECHQPAPTTGRGTMGEKRWGKLAALNLELVSAEIVKSFLT
jgi:hypothetical protein